MKKPISKVLCLVLCLTLIFTTMVSASSDTVNQTKENMIREQFKNLKTNILMDNDNIRKVEISDENGTVSAIYNKETGDLRLFDQDSKEVFNTNINTSANTSNISLINQKDIQPAVIAGEWRIVSSRTDFWYDYSYTKYDNYAYEYMWDVSTDSSGMYDVYEDYYNKDQLSGFKSSVDAMRQHELEVIAVTSGAAVAAIIAFISMAPETLGMSLFLAGLLAIGVAAAAGIPAYLVYTSKLDANEYFMQI